MNKLFLFTVHGSKKQVLVNMDNVDYIVEEVGIQEINSEGAFEPVDKWLKIVFSSGSVVTVDDTIEAITGNLYPNV